MAVQFVDYIEPTNTGPNVLARWDKVRDDIGKTEDFINQLATELQAMAMLHRRNQHRVVSRDEQIQSLSIRNDYLTVPEMTRWDHFKALFGF